MLFRLAALAVFAMPIGAISQSATFDLIVDGKLSGKDAFTLSKDKRGYKLSSRFKYSIHAQEANFFDEFKYSDSYSYLEGSMTDQGETQVAISYVPNKPRTEINIGRVSSGLQSNDFFPIKPDFFLLPPFDAGATQALLLAVVQPAGPRALNIYSPVAGGVDGMHRDGAPAHRPSVDAKWSTGPDVAAMLDDKPLTAKTYLLATPSFHWIFYADQAHTLLQCDLPDVKIRYIRQGFRLAGAPVALSGFSSD